MQLSYRMGMVKPDPEIYQSMVETIGLPPERLLFFDDNQINIDAARRIGINAYRVRGVTETLSVLRSLESSPAVESL